MAPPSKQLLTTLLICLALELTTLGTYWGVFSAGFLNYDDTDYVTRNPHVQAGLTGEGVRWAFTSREASNWHPLTWLSHMLDCSLFGLNPAAQHAANLAFHMANSILLFLVLRRITATQWRSAFVAALFALHPLHVESVAWVAERKDVLSTFFWVLSLGAYCRYAEFQSRKRIWYGLTLALFTCALMAKPMVVTLPFLLLLLDFWPLGRMPADLSVLGRRVLLPGPSPKTRYAPRPWRGLILEKFPLCLLALASCVVTIWAQRPSFAEAVPFKFRLLNAALSYLRYFEKALWPAPLYVNYSYPSGWPIWLPLFAIVALLSLSYGALRGARGRRYLATGWFWFVGTLVPVIGLVQVGIQAMADRYTYVPLIGLFIIASWGGYDLASNWRWPAWLRWGTPAVLLGLCASLTVVQVRYWRDNFSLFQHAVSLDPENLLAQHNLGISYADIGDYTSAVEHLAAAIKIAPTYGTLYSDMGWYQARLGKYADAIESFRTALKMGAPEGPARWGLAVALAEQGQLSEAETEIVAALQLTPVSWEAHDEYGMILIRMGRPEEALGQFLQAAKLEPGSPSARLHAAKVLERLGRFSEAVVQYRQILATDPETVEALNALAWMLATSPDRAVRNGAESVRLAEQACRLTQDRVPEILGTLGAAYAESGRFDDATAAAERAAKVAASLGKQELAGKYEELAQLFRTHQALHEPVSQNNHASHATDSDAGFRR